MHNFFDLSRFRSLFIKQTVEHARIYGMSIAVLIGAMLLGGSFLFFIIPGPVDSGIQTALFVSGLLLCGTIFTSTIFSDLGTTSRAIPALTLPASTWEKYLVAWLYTYPVFIGIYSAIFYTVLVVLSHLKNTPEHPGQYFNLFQPDMWLLLVFYAILHALTLLGAIQFDKWHFIKTGFLFFVAYAIVVIVNTLFLRGLTGLTLSSALPFGYLNFFKAGEYFSIAATVKASNRVVGFTVLATLLLWYAAYCKLKEKQV